MREAELVRMGLFGGLTGSEYTVEYTDSTHCPPGIWFPLLAITPESPRAPLIGAEEAQTFYWISLSAGKDKAVKDEDDRRSIQDALVQALLRASVLSPRVENDTLNDIFRLSKSGAVVLIPDTNALSTGTLHWLVGALSNTQVWLLPVVVSLIQVQQRDALLKSLVGKRKAANLSKALRSRQLINASLSLLERQRERYQVLELDPQLLRYVRPAGSGSGDPDEGDVLEDRLLLEAVHSILGATRSRAEKRVVTSDVLLARMLRAEGVPAIFLQKPATPETRFPCVRYEPLAKLFVGSHLPALLWELTHTFSEIRMVDSYSKPVIQLQAYWPKKSAREWAEQSLLVSLREGPKGAEMTTQPESAAVSTATDLPAPGSSRKDDGRVKELPRREKLPLAEPIVAPARGPLSSAVLIEVSFPQVLRLGNALLQGPGSVKQVLARLPEDARPSDEIARLGFEMLVRAGLVDFQGGTLTPGARLAELGVALDSLNLDRASEIWEGYQPYAIVKRLIQESSVKMKETYSTIARLLDRKPSREGSDRLWRLPVYLGQAWSDGSDLRDGSKRPLRDEILQHFVSLFKSLQNDGLCLLSDILPRLCRELRMSPWAAGREIQAGVEEGLLPQISFQPSVGKRLTARDQVVIRKNGEIRTIAVPVDRLEIGGRPVFAVVRGRV